MALNKQRRAEIDQIIERLMEEGDGKFQDGEARDLIREYLRKEADDQWVDQLIDTEAAAQVERFNRTRRWEPTAEQPSLFDREAIIQLGEGVSVRLDKAKANDLTQHQEVLFNNYANQTEMYLRKNRTLMEWIARLRGTSKTLGEIMTGVTSHTA